MERVLRAALGASLYSLPAYLFPVSFSSVYMQSARPALMLRHAYTNFDASTSHAPPELCPLSGSETSNAASNGSEYATTKSSVPDAG